MTTRGATERHMQRVAEVVSSIAEDPKDEAVQDRLRAEIEAICRELAPV